jgi:hypothetical protein
MAYFPGVIPESSRLALLTSAVLLLAGACGGNTRRGDGNLAESGGRDGAAGEGVADAGEPATSGGRHATGGATSAGDSGCGGFTSGAAGCGSGGRVSTGGSASATRLRVEPVRTGSPTKLDVLLVVDNSISMTDEQSVLREALPGFLQRLSSPRCLDAEGQPTGESSDAGRCADGGPEFSPIEDIHVGVITSSLGDMGSGDACPSGLVEKDDRGQLVPSVRPLDPEPAGDFLVLRPGAEGGNADLSALVADLDAQLAAVGDTGCGYEAPLEAMYRFLIDPEPPETVDKGANHETLRGPTSSVLLEQRSAFLRPDSLVAIVILSDENDCSIVDYGQGHLVGMQSGGTFFMPRATAACELDPNDACCFSCALSDSFVPAGCTPPEEDPSCAKGENTVEEDHPNVRCHEQKRRFGVDLLQPIERYLDGLTTREVFVRHDDDGDGVQEVAELRQNPLFESKAGKPRRHPSMIFLAGILGVPWPDVADEASWTSDDSVRYLSSAELEELGRWDWVLGSNGKPPLDGLMYESRFDRTQVPGIPQSHPAGEDVGGRLAPASETDPNTNPINGHESNGRDGSLIQPACTFPLANPRDCQSSSVRCDCDPEQNVHNHSSCQGALQTHAAAYPGIRQLELLRSFGKVTENAIVGSICPKPLPANSAYGGYRPVFDALIERMRTSIRAECLERELPRSDADGRSLARLLEVLPKGDGPCAPCDDLRGRTELDANAVELKSAIGCDSQGDCAPLCVCEVTQFDGIALSECQAGAELRSADPGFCLAGAAGCSSSQSLRLPPGIPRASASLWFAYDPNFG